jgi:hypothetical protein
MVRALFVIVRGLLNAPSPHADFPFRAFNRIAGVNAIAFNADVAIGAIHLFTGVHAGPLLANLAIGAIKIIGAGIVIHALPALAGLPWGAIRIIIAFVFAHAVYADAAGAVKTIIAFIRGIIAVTVYADHARRAVPIVRARNPRFGISSPRRLFSRRKQYPHAQEEQYQNGNEDSSKCHVPVFHAITSHSDILNYSVYAHIRLHFISHSIL